MSAARVESAAVWSLVLLVSAELAADFLRRMTDAPMMMAAPMASHAHMGNGPSLRLNALPPELGRRAGASGTGASVAGWLTRPPHWAGPRSRPPPGTPEP